MIEYLVGNDPKSYWSWTPYEWKGTKGKTPCAWKCSGHPLRIILMKNGKYLIADGDGFLMTPSGNKRQFGSLLIATVAANMEAGHRIMEQRRNEES